jgi:phage-related protein
MSREEILWIEPDGTQHNLMDIPNTAVNIGRAGFDMPPIRHILKAVPFRHGKRHEAFVADERRFDIPVHFSAETWETLRTRIHEVERMFWPDPTQGMGKLRINMPDGTGREIECYYESGLQGNEGVDSQGTNWTNKVITLLAPEPFWKATAASQQIYTQGTPAEFFPLLPIKLSSTSIFSDAVANNLGDVEAWPVWTIEGPMTRIILTNESYDPERVIDLTYTLTAGQTITIDTDEDNRTVVRDNGTDLYSALTKRDLWPLKAGVNNIEIQMDGATVDSQVTLTWYARYLGQP